MRHLIKSTATTLLLLVSTTAFARASQQPAATPTPAAPTPETSAAPPAPSPHGLPNFDPCGGPKELYNKIGPVPCVFVAGEGAVTGSYTSINAPGSVQISGPSGREVSVPIYGHFVTFPAATIIVGLGYNTQIQFTVPSYAQLNTQRVGLSTGTTNAAVDIKQRLYFSYTKFTQVSVDFGYTPPTGSTGFNGLTPSYQTQLTFAQPLDLNWTLGGDWIFKNATVSSPVNAASQRVWSDPFLFYTAWSPAHGGFALIPLVYHQFNPDQTSFIIGAEQLLGRHLMLAVNYGGFNAVEQGQGPIAGVLRFNANVYPRTLYLGLTFLSGESNLPTEETEQHQ